LPPVLLELPPRLLDPRTPVLELEVLELEELASEVPELLELPEGLVAAPVLPELLTDKIAKSIRPDAGLMMQSVMVPNWVPPEPMTCAPFSWLALIS
jgi:hypothetical protein